jgi:hypothetical protein
VIPSHAGWQLREWWLPKAGNAPEEYEDAFRTRPEGGRFAVADGATETSFSGLWAAALVAAFAESPPAWEASEADLVAWLQPLQMAWHATVPWDRLPWYGLEKARAGAFASLLGMEFFPRPEGGALWRARALGDTVLCHVREGTLLAAWPVAAASQFGSRPRLLPSAPERTQVALDAWSHVEGEALPGDRFFLVTDAVGHWALAAHEAGEPPWETLWSIGDPEGLAALVAVEREARRLRNDDVTLVAFAVPESWSLPHDPEEEVVALVPAGEITWE